MSVMGEPVRHNTVRELAVFLRRHLQYPGFWLPALMMQSRGQSMPIVRDLLLRAGTFGPTVSGLVLAYIFGGKAGYALCSGPC